MPNEKLTTNSYCETCRNMTLAIYAPRDMLAYDFADTAVFAQRLPLSWVTVLK
jgi:hypothetical protein